MKALVFSDLHGHNFREFSYINEVGVNSRLQDQVIVLKAIHNTALNAGVDCIIFLGDLNHLKNNVDSQVIKVLSNELGMMTTNFPIFVLPGNHDYRLWGSEPALLEVLENMNNNIHILERRWQTICGQSFFCLPYTRRILGVNEDLMKLGDYKHCPKDVEHSFFLGHQDVIGVKYGKFLVDKGLNPQILSKKFRLSLVGHIHDMQKPEENVIVVGACMQHNFSDAGKDRGWWIIDTDEITMSFVVNKCSPKFFDIKAEEDINDKVPGDRDKDFYRIHVNGNSLPDIYKSIRWKRVSFSSLGDSKSRSQILFTDNDDDLIKKYVDSKELNSIDSKILIDLGRKYL